MSDQSFPFTPYKGLTSYAEEDAPYFFGREGVVNNIVARVQGWPLTLLYGASGVGKSSVLHAGVVREFRRQAERRREGGEPPEYCVVLFNSWSDDPVPGLLGAVRRAVAQNFEGKALTTAAQTLAETLRAWSAEIGCDLIVILDQFEEYFTYHSHEDGPGKLPQELSHAVNDANRGANFLISIREDALAKLERFQYLIPNLLNQSLRLRALGPEEAREAIEKPIAKYNSLSGKAPVGIDPKLVDAILHDAQGGLLEEGAAGASKLAARRAYVEAPYLQQIMTRLWHEEAHTGLLRLSTYERLGRAGEIVRTHLSKTIAKLDEGEQETAARIFRYLVTPSGTKIAQSAEDIADYALLPQDDVSRVLDKLSARDILILRAVAPPPDEPGVTRYEIFHDVLAAPITAWWKEYEAAARERAIAFEEARDRGARVMRRRLAWSTALVVLLSAVTLFAVAKTRLAKSSAELARAAQQKAEVEKINAEVSRKAAEDARDEAKRQRGIAAMAAEDAEKQRNAAVQALAAAKSAKAALEKQKAEVELQKERAVVLLAESRRLRDVADIAKVKAERLTGVANNALDALTRSLTREEGLRKAAEDRERLVSAQNQELLKKTEEAVAQRKKVAEEEEERIKIDQEGAAYAELTLRKHRKAVNTAAFSPDLRKVVTAGEDGNVLIWDTSDPLFHTGKKIPPDPSEPAEQPAPTSAAPTGESSSKSDESSSSSIVRVSARPSPAAASPTPTPAPAPTPVVAAISRDKGKDKGQSKDKGTLVVTASGSEAVVWDGESRKALYRLAGHTGPIRSVAFSRDNRFVVAGGDDSKALVWDLNGCGKDGLPCQPAGVINGHDKAVMSTEFNPADPYTVVTAGKDGTARVTQWGPCESGGTCRSVVFKGHDRSSGRGVNSASFSPDGQFVVTSGDDGEAIIWRSKDGKRVRKLREFSGVLVSRGEGVFGFLRTRKIYKEVRPVRSAAFLPGKGPNPGKNNPYPYVVTAGDSQEVRVWDIDTGTIVRAMSGHLSGIRSVGLSPMGKYIITAGVDRTARIWNPCRPEPKPSPDAAANAKPKFKKGGAERRFDENYCKFMEGVDENLTLSKPQGERPAGPVTFLPPASYPPAAGSRFGLRQ